ncbi:MAG: aspartyl protease family protein [Bacteroidetes bacterium]|nr:aspartyl protease family protein [Bacteroidota bacterium]
MKRLLFLFALVLAFGAQNICAQSVYGEMTLEYQDGYLFAKTSMPDGGKAWFAVDLAAQATAVTKAFASNMKIQKEQSSNDPLDHGTAQYALGGFGFRGEIVGRTTMPSLSLGGLSFTDASVMVMNQAPTVAGRTIAGILGVDLLRRAEVAVFRYGNAPTLVLKSKTNTAVKGTIEMPMRVVNNAIFVEGTLNGQKVDYLLDTGSPESYLPIKTLRLTGAAAVPNSTREITTLDGEKAKVRGAQVESITLGGEEFTGLPFNIAELPVFGRLPQTLTPVLLGNAFFSSMQFVEINFEGNTVRLKKQ